MLIDVLSCRRGMSNSGVVSRIAGEAIGADGYLTNMGSEDFLLCLSRQALEAAAKEANVLPRQKVRETRAALVDHFKEGHFVHSLALFAPDPNDVADLIKHADTLDDEEAQVDAAEDGLDAPVEGAAVDTETGGDTGEGAPGGGRPAAEGDGLGPFEGGDDLPDTFDDAPATTDPDDEQAAYRVAAE